MDVLLGVLALEEQELGDHEISVQVVDLSVDEDDPVLEETGVYVVGSLSAAGLLDDHGDKIDVLLIHEGRCLTFCHKGTIPLQDVQYFPLFSSLPTLLLTSIRLPTPQGPGSWSPPHGSGLPDCPDGLARSTPSRFASRAHHRLGKQKQGPELGTEKRLVDRTTGKGGVAAIPRSSCSRRIRSLSGKK